MAIKTGNCGCREGLATEKRTLLVRVEGKPELRQLKMCQKCAAATDLDLGRQGYAADYYETMRRQQAKL